MNPNPDPDPLVRGMDAVPDPHQNVIDPQHCRIRDVLVWIRIPDPYHLITVWIRIRIRILLFSSVAFRMTKYKFF
jgi:hypothetical protein